MEINTELVTTLNSLFKNIEEKRRYSRYDLAISRLVPWLCERIDENPEKNIRVKMEDIAKEMGPKFERKSHTAFYQGVKFVLFYNGIVVDKGLNKDDQHILIMRRRNEEDELPSYLKKRERLVSENLSEEISEIKIYDPFI